MLLNRRSRGRPGYGCTAFEAFGNPGHLKVDLAAYMPFVGLGGTAQWLRAPPDTALHSGPGF